MPPTDQHTWRNHFVPEFYLARFADETGEVLRTFKPPTGVLHEQRHAPKYTGYQEDLYSIERDFDIGPFGRGDRIEHEVFEPIDTADPPGRSCIVAGTQPKTVFYSWQSGPSSKVNRGLISDALERAVKVTAASPP